MKKRILIYGITLLTILSFAFITSSTVKARNNETIIIYAKDSNGNVIASAKGVFQNDAVLNVENDSSKLGYGEIGRMINPDYTTSSAETLAFPTILDFGVSITHGSYQGKLELSFFVGDSYNGLDAKVITRGDQDFETFKTSVKEGQVTVLVEDKDLTTQTPFVIGLPNPTHDQTKIMPDKDKINQNQSLTFSEKMKTGWIYVKGSFTEDTSLNVKTLSKNEKVYKKLAPSDRDVVGAYSLKLNKGKQNGSIRVIFPINKKYVNQKVIVEHLLKDGSIISNHYKVKKDGSISIKTTELGAFMITAEKTKKAGSLNTQYLFLGGIFIVAVIVFVGIMVVIKRHHRN